MSVAIYCDENVHGAIQRGLARLGIDATSAVALGNLGLSDLEQLAVATALGRSLLSHDAHDFPRLHWSMRAEDLHHAGIIVARQDLPIGEIVRRLARLCSTVTRDEMADRLEYLGGW